MLHEGETEPPPDIKKLWAEYRKIDKILAETIKVGQTPREIVKNYKAKFAANRNNSLCKFSVTDLDIDPFFRRASVFGHNLDFDPTV